MSGLVTRLRAELDEWVDMTWKLRLLNVAALIGVVVAYPFIWVMKKLSPRGGWGD